MRGVTAKTPLTLPGNLPVTIRSGLWATKAVIATNDNNLDLQAKLNLVEADEGGLKRVDSFNPLVDSRVCFP